jgi:GntR family transcriptional repressor for pyruvate dehydrogenase complex
MNVDQSLFEPVGHESVADSVIAQIEDMIVSGILRGGSKLPSERELAETLDVSRVKLREALKRLEDRQLIEVRHGEGSYIAPLIGSAMAPALIDLYARHHAAFFDYLEYRREQEGFAASLAAERATEADKEIITALMDRLESAHEVQDSKASQEADIGFHSAIVDASHNSTLIHMMTSIYDLTQRGVFYNRDYLRTIDGTGKLLLDQHKAIGNAILQGKPEEARQTSRAHIDFVEKSFRLGHDKAKRELVAGKRRTLAKSMSNGTK